MTAFARSLTAPAPAAFSFRQWFARNDGWVLGTAGFVGLTLFWQVAGMLIEDKTFLSTPLDVVVAARGQIESGQLLDDFMISLMELVPGFAAAAITGIVLGFVIGRSRSMEYVFDPFIWFFYSAPVIAFYPLFIIWFGLGPPTVVVLTFFFAFFPILANTVTGVQQVDRAMVRAARSFGASRLQLAVFVIFPGSVPAIAAGLRLGIGRALIGTIVGEFFGATGGLGYRIALYGNQMDTAQMFVPVVVVMIIGVALLKLLQRFEDAVGTWRV
jgi:NitT/TauT family transport system permease protein